MKGWRTLALAAVVALTGFLASPEVTAWVAENLPETAGVVGAAIVGLRAITSGPMFEK